MTGPGSGPTPLAWLRESLARREPAYLEVADLVVDVDEGTPDDLARLVVDGLLADVGTQDRTSAQERG